MAKIPMWTDIGLGNLKDWEDLDYKLSFLMETYDIISLEKCLFVGANDQNTVRVALTYKWISLRHPPGGRLPEPDLPDAHSAPGVPDQDPLLLGFLSHQMLPVHPEVPPLPLPSLTSPPPFPPSPFLPGCWTSLPYG